MATLWRPVQSYLDHLTIERALSVNTLASYRRDLTRYTRWLEAAEVTDLADVGPREVAGHVAALRGEGLSASSTARAASAVRGLHKFLVLEGVTSVDPAREVKPPALPKRLPKALDVDQVHKLLSTMDRNTPRGLRDQALLEFLYGTGARISEAVGASIDDLALRDGAVRLIGKGHKTRVVPVGSYARDAIDAYLVRGRPTLVQAGRGSPAVFLNARGGRLSRQAAWLILRKAAQSSRCTLNRPCRARP